MTDSLATGTHAHLGAAGEPTPDAYYVRVGEDRFQSTIHAQGAWNADHQHMSATAALLVHAVQHNHPRPDMQVSQLTFKILGTIGAGEFEVRTEVTRPGRTIELVEASLIVHDRPVVKSLIWRLTRNDTSDVSGTDGIKLTPPGLCSPLDLTKIWGGGFVRSVEFRSVVDRGPGSGAAWARGGCDIVDGEESDPMARYVGVIDTVNGIAVRQDPREYMFPNVDLTIHLFREPVSDWAGMDTTVYFGDTGAGLTATTLYDEHGVIGRAAQILTVRKVPR